MNNLLFCLIVLCIIYVCFINTSSIDHLTNIDYNMNSGKPALDKYINEHIFEYQMSGKVEK
jgi:hypothetical protein